MLIFLAFGAIETQGQTATDVCSFAAGNQYTAQNICTFQTFNKPDAFNPSFSPNTCGSTNFDDAYGWFTAIGTSTTITYDPDLNYRPVLHVFTGSCGALTQRACIDAGSNGANAQLTLTTVVGTNYLVRIQRSGTSNGMDGRLCIFSPPLNDDPCGAIDLTLGTTCSLTNYTSLGSTPTTGVPAPGCSTYSGSDVWFKFTAPASRAVTIRTTAGTVTNLAMALYSATSCAGPFTLISCDNLNGPGNMPFLTFLGTELVAGNTYYLRAWRNGGGAGTFNLCANTAPTSGTCFYALRMSDSAGDGWGGSTVNISINGGAAVPYALANGDVDVAYIPINNGQPVVISYAGVGEWENEISYELLMGDGIVFSDGPPPSNGVVASFNSSCTPPGPPPSDCSGGTTICGDASLNSNPRNTGRRADLNGANRGCLLNDERQGLWYGFSPSAGGVLGFTIAPGNPSDDYDFAVWGPSSSVICPPSGAPFRCNYSGTPGNTGLSNAGSNASENSSGSKWSSQMNVTAGQIYVLYISNWSRSGLAHTLSWQLSAGADLGCAVLPVEMFDFNGVAEQLMVRLEWSTASEVNSSHYIVERRSEDGTFLPIGLVAASNNTQTTTTYGIFDQSPEIGLNYYRVIQVDLNGTSKSSSLVAVPFRQVISTNRPFPNPTTGDLNIDIVLEKEQRVTIQVLDAGGRVVRTFTKTFMAGPQLFQGSASGLDAGAYNVLIFSDKSAPIQAGRFIKQ